MKSIGWSVWLILFATLGVTIANANQDPLVVEHASEEEARQVQEVSDAFERRMRETRDVSSLIDLFLDDFMRLHIAENAPNQPVSLISSIPLSLKSDLAKQVSRQDWERFYAARLNVRYYFVLLLASRERFSDGKEPEDSPQKLYPVEVLRLLQADPFLKGDYGLEHDHSRHVIETLDEFLSLITTLEQATLILREQFLKHPPEQTPIYQENLRLASNEQKTRSTRLIWPHVYGTDESRLGFPKGTRYFHRITADSMFELWFVKTTSGMKIVWAQVYPFN